MTGVKIKIRSLLKSFPSAEQKVAEYVINNCQKVPFQTVYEIAGAVRVSVASVSRFVRALGYRSFKDFKVELAQDSTVGVPEIYGAITLDDTDAAIVQKVFTGNRQTIEDTLKLVDVSMMVEASKALLQGKKLVFFGIGSSGNIARDAALRFSHLDLQAEAYIDPMLMLIQSRRLRKNDVACGISHSGRSIITVESLRLSQQSGAVTIGISNYSKSPLNRFSRYFFCTAFQENMVRVAALSSRIAQMCLIDALYLLAARHKKDLWDVEDLNMLAEDILRVKG
jgi:DNA-binding MurR/RpiR family transcriptional regulator